MNNTPSFSEITIYHSCGGEMQHMGPLISPLFGVAAPRSDMKIGYCEGCRGLVSLGEFDAALSEFVRATEA